MRENGAPARPVERRRPRRRGPVHAGPRLSTGLHVERTDSASARRLPRARRRGRAKFASPRAKAARCSPISRCVPANRTVAIGSRRCCGKTRTKSSRAPACVRRSQRCASRCPPSAQSALLADTESVGVDAAIDRAATCAPSAARWPPAHARRCRRRSTHYRGDLLDGFDARSTAFDEWLSSERLALRKQMSEALQQAHRPVRRERRRGRRARRRAPGWSRSSR